MSGRPLLMASNYKYQRLKITREMISYRQKKRGGMYEGFASDGNVTLAPFSSKSTDVYTDEAFKPVSLCLIK